MLVLKPVAHGEVLVSDDRKNLHSVIICSIIFAICEDEDFCRSMIRNQRRFCACTDCLFHGMGQDSGLAEYTGRIG